MKELSRIETEHVAGNGLLHRRMFLAAGAAMGAGALADPAGAAPLPVEPWMQIPGAPFNGYGQPSKYEAKVARTFASAPGTGGTGYARTPHHLLNGMITPSGLHYERSHSGIPDIDPDVHRLVIHGLVKRPLVFTLDDLARYPMQSRIAFLECAGNSGALFAKTPVQVNVQAIHGLLSCSEWTGVKLSMLLEEAGHRSEGQMAARGRRRRRRHEPQRPARQGARRCDDRALPEWRAREAVERLSDAPAAARLRGQHERQVAAPHQIDRGADHDQGRDLEVYDFAAVREGAAIRLPA